jgi:hypothetical protein
VPLILALPEREWQGPKREDGAGSGVGSPPPPFFIIMSVPGLMCERAQVYMGQALSDFQNLVCTLAPFAHTL